MRFRTTSILTLSCALMELLICFPSRAAQVEKDSPPKRFVDIGACPFECCTYRLWTANDSVQLVDRAQGKRVIATLHKGEAVQGLTGEVISTPLAAKASHDIPETPIKAGDTFYVLHYDGEGYWKVWFRGKTTYVHESVMDLPHPKTEWWVKVKRRDGAIGWTLSGEHFLHQDACE